MTGKRYIEKLKLLKLFTKIILDNNIDFEYLKVFCKLDTELDGWGSNHGHTGPRRLRLRDLFHTGQRWRIKTGEQPGLCYLEHKEMWNQKWNPNHEVSTNCKGESRAKYSTFVGWQQILISQGQFHFIPFASTQFTICFGVSIFNQVLLLISALK